MLTPRSNPCRLTSINFCCGSLKPRRGHPAIGMPDGGKSLPVASIAPDDPVLNDFVDCELVGGEVGHLRSPGLRAQRMVNMAMAEMSAANAAAKNSRSLGHRIAIN